MQYCTQKMNERILSGLLSHFCMIQQTVYLGYSSTAILRADINGLTSLHILTHCITKENPEKMARK